VVPSANEGVVVRGLTRVFGSGPTQVEALRGIDLTVAPGEFVAVMGSSGSGKSTLLHILAGLDCPSAGMVRVGGTDLAALDDDERTLLRRTRIGLVFQSFNLLDILDTAENVALPLAIAGTAPAEARRRALRALGQVGLERRARHRPGELSGGEQQRVAVARALVIAPALLLADEPTGNLDSGNAAGVISLLRGLADERRHTILMVTHDAAQAAQADRLVVLRDGRILSQTTSRGRHGAIDVCVAAAAAPARSHAADAAGDRCWSVHCRGDGGDHPRRTPLLP
jgi:putative ABC transport system ATP-binding protein